MSEDKKLVVNLPEGTSKAEVILREGEAAKALDPKAPVRIALSGTIGAPVEYLTRRKDEGDQFNVKRAHVIVERESVRVCLVFNENDEYTRGTVEGKLSYHPKFVEFGINSGKSWEPAKLGEFFKMNRAFFNSKEENMKLVNQLKNFKAKVNAAIEQERKDNGSYKDNYSQVVQSNMPSSFKLKLPIFKGFPVEDLEVELYASVDGREVALSLVSPGACQLLEELRDKLIDEQTAAIRALCPDIVIIEK